MIVSVKFCVDGKEVAEVQSEQISEEAALAWQKFVHNFCILVKDRDVTESPLVKAHEADGDKP